MPEQNVHTIMLHDQIPRFGSGMRRIVVVKIGPKWVVLGCGGKRARIPVDKWRDIMISGADYRERNRKGA